MKNLEKFIIGSVALVLILVAVVSFGQKPNEVLGSVARTSEYQSTTTDATFTVAPGYKVLKRGEGTFGSLVVTTTGTGVINVYDATTTSALLRTNTATTTLAHLTTSAAGTYTFDSIVHYGLLIETVGTNTGSTTITYR